jgi:UDP-3-O-[3-hydroxymyristoyl] glucosamine N-acyltransferase
MEFTAATIAGFLKGEIVGNPDIKVNNIAKIEEGHAGDLSFLANPKYEQYLYSTGSSVVLVNSDFVPSAPISATLIKVKNAYESFASLLTLVDQSKPKKKGIHPTAVIEPGAEIGADVYIGAYAVISEKCVIGDGSRIYPHVYIGEGTRLGRNCLIYQGARIYHECIIGNNCTLHAGCVIGGDGFGFAPQSESEFMKIPQIGNVILEDNVEVGANSAIDRATIGSTVIRRGVKIDNLIQIGHNVEIGENTVMAGQAGVAGSTKIGKNCMLAGQVGVAGHLKIADGVKIGAQAGLNSDIKEENSIIIGTPAMDYKQFMKSYVIFRKLTDLKTKVDSMGKDIESLKNR